MPAEEFDVMTREDLERRYSSEMPRNEHPVEGYALVNVLDADAFRERHIPGSINIPKGREQEFEDRFDKSKELVLYCASEDCDASPTVARRLTDRGFTQVHDYAKGMQDWQNAGLPVEGSAG